jgi:hypothetical protein
VAAAAAAGIDVLGVVLGQVSRQALSGRRPALSQPPLGCPLRAIPPREEEDAQAEGELHLQKVRI